MNDPELMEAMQNPKVMAAFTEAQSNPAKLMELMADPEVGPVLQKLMVSFLTRFRFLRTARLLPALSFDRLT